MKYFKQLLHTKAPTNETLLDIALILSILPHLFISKFFMLLYVAIALIFILKKISKVYLLMALGTFLIGLSFFNTFNFTEFSKIQFFVSLISSLLIFAVTLQRVTQEVNIYLKISPILLMMLSFFFFNSIIMLLYSIATLFVFTLVYIWSRMDATLLELLRFCTKLFLLSLPGVTVLFLAFPRISIEKADFGFHGDNYVGSGYSSSMHVTNKRVSLSNKIIMEVLFDDEKINDSQLYFRGSTLVHYQESEWVASLAKENTKERLTKTKNIKAYEVTLYPHANKWIYALDVPVRAPAKVKQNSDYTLSSQSPLYQKKKFLLKSALSYTLLKNETDSLENFLKVDKDIHDRSYKELQQIISNEMEQKERLELLWNFFKTQKLAYSLEPTGLDSLDSMDSFLFDSKVGYCVHFSSAFALAARMIGIPSRVVTGFKADKKNMINNYLLVKGSDAHAWVELYLKGSGWVRFDPTRTATVDLSLQTAQRALNEETNPYFTKLNNYFLYTKYMLNYWILDYNRNKQMQILKDLLSDTLYLLKFLFVFVLFGVSISLMFLLLQKSKFKDPLSYSLQKLIKFLKKKGLQKSSHMSMEEFFSHVEKERGVSMQRLSQLYNELKYAKRDDKQRVEEFDKEILQTLEQLRESDKKSLQ